MESLRPGRGRMQPQIGQKDRSSTEKEVTRCFFFDSRDIISVGSEHTLVSYPDRLGKNNKRSGYETKHTRPDIFLPEIVVTLGAHAQKGYGMCVCVYVYVCVSTSVCYHSSANIARFYAQNKVRRVF